ncbi:hypothetical protein CSPX01_15721 [Colletotrichum filicis]|nr:hypothetical protein CSPX01_15721 [Colletotrichum filicis]
MSFQYSHIPPPSRLQTSQRARLSSQKLDSLSAPTTPLPYLYPPFHPPIPARPPRDESFSDPSSTLPRPVTTPPPLPLFSEICKSGPS